MHGFLAVLILVSLIGGKTAPAFSALPPSMAAACGGGYEPPPFPFIVVTPL